MSKLEELINTLCPDGVGYKTLSDIANYSSSRIDAKEVDAQSYVGVDNLLPDKMGKIDSSYVPTEGRLTRFSEGDILIGNIRPYLNKIWLATHDGGTNGDVLAIQINNRKTISPRYLFYVLSSDQFFLYDMQNAKGAKMPRGDKSAVIKYLIPLPPLSVQNEIVRILDNFRELTAELTAELTERKKQYEYYRDFLFDFSDDVPRVKLVDITDISRGVRVVKKQLIPNGKYPVYQNCLTAMGYYDKHNCDADTTYVISAGAAGEIGFCDKDFWAADDCLIFSNLNGVINKYIYYFLTTKQDFIRSNVRRASIPRLSRRVIENLQIPFVSLEEQERIVAILDRFDTLCNDLTSGLPAEIEARRKQYEYYRDRILTFKEKVA